MNLSERLLKRLRAEGVVPLDQEVHMRRANASRSMRTNGAWSWFAEWGTRRTEETVGSQWSMAQCLKAPRWEVSKNEFGETNIDPTDENGRYVK
jgi:G3E family GTPase